MAHSVQFEHTFLNAVPEAGQPCLPQKIEQPLLIYFNALLNERLQWPINRRLPGVLSGQPVYPSMQPSALVYAGHQFGHFNPQLGDGRAHLLGEVVIDSDRLDVALKGSGQTPYSRRGDGQAALGPMLREALMSHAMSALSIATTQALAVTATLQPVYRHQVHPGAVLTRLAASHIRVGTFEYFAAQKNYGALKRLADYVIDRHYPTVKSQSDRYVALFKQVAQRQAKLVAQWMSVGFIHGVMNTDNMSIVGETIDYGPCAFMEAYHPKTVFSSIDEYGRYAYDQQPIIAQWNLACFAQTLLPLIDDHRQQALSHLTPHIQAFMKDYHSQWLTIMLAKAGLIPKSELHHKDQQLIQDWLALLQQNSVDFTLAWRYLSDFLEGNTAPLIALFEQPELLHSWLARWQDRRSLGAISASQMRLHNPWIIPRNHQVEAALEQAESGELDAFYQLMSALAHPYEQRAQWSSYAEPAPNSFTQSYQTFCGT